MFVLLALTALTACGPGEEAAPSLSPSATCAALDAEVSRILGGPTGAPGSQVQAKHLSEVRVATHMIVNSPSCFSAETVARAQEFLESQK